MGKLSDEKLAKLKALDSQGGFWYITKQNLVFRDLCFMAKILEAWGDRKEENYETFFNRHKILPDFGSFDSVIPHRATKNCEYLGLTVPSEKYSAQNLTPFYFALKKLCNGDFDRLSLRPQIIDKQLERMFIDSKTNTTYTVNFQICPFMFLFKVLLLIGDITKSYKITISEFKLFVATAQTWSDYFQTVESILRYREDVAFKAQCDSNSAKVSDVRYNILAQNHSQLNVEGKDISIKDGEIRNIRRKVAEYELSDKIQTAEDIFETMFDSQAEKCETSSSYTPYLTALRTKPFMLLAGISGTGKSRIAREIAKACWPIGHEQRTKQVPENFCMVQVKPNWHDSTELLGYISRINGEKYVVGDFTKFVAKATQHPERPYILCLDEMNLAPVEQYFAEYLSVVESRKAHEDGTITTDPLIDYENTEAYKSLIDQLIRDEQARKEYLTEQDGKRLTIPQNLFVIGTVNMDETTFSFSRKVLDRAMTIEMNEVNLFGGLEKSTDSDLGYIGNIIIGHAAEGKDVYADNKQLCDDVINYLGEVNKVLEGTPFKIAYRTRNEFLLYAVNRLVIAPESELWQTLDEMTSMKILSRVEGDSERCKRPLEEIQRVLNETLSAEQQTKSISLAKIKEMLDKLQKTGYTSYWT